MAAQLSGLDEADLGRLSRLIAAAGLPVNPPAISKDDWMRSMGMDKKVQEKRLRFILLDTLGSGRLTWDYDEQRLDEILRG
jgi:3-dehydroquinate synthase